MIKIPTWEDVFVPKIMLETIKEGSGFSINSLVNQLVFHNEKQLTVSYLCDNCGFLANKKKTDEISHCDSCDYQSMKCTQSFSPQQRIPDYIRRGDFMLQIIEKMEYNFVTYFKEQPERSMEWEWGNRCFWVRFAGGDGAIAKDPKTAIIFASILTPYLWDLSYDWENCCKYDPIDYKSITQYIDFNQE